MKHHIDNLHELSNATSRRIIGLMSGTSLDGLDIFYGRFIGQGFNTRVESIAFETIPYVKEMKDRILEIFAQPFVDFYKLVSYNAWLGRLHGEMVNEFLRKNNIQNSDVDCIASHGQTVLHAPAYQHDIKGVPNATLQIADGDHIAMSTGILTVSDFRQKHLAAGGEGAPLAVYGDILLFSSIEEPRILLNLGGIANFTFIDVYGNGLVTDTGPANTLMDACIKKMFQLDYDRDAIIAKRGKVHFPLLDMLLDEPFLALPFPKSTGPELFSYTRVEQMISDLNIPIDTEDIMATLNRFSSQTIIDAIDRVTSDSKTIIYTSGGGSHNPMLIQSLKDYFGEHRIKSISALGINPDAKEAILFATLANECLAGLPTSIICDGYFDISLGKISFPS